MKRSQKTLAVLVCLLLSAPAASAWDDAFTAALKNGGALAVNAKGDVLYQHRADESFIPASTIKVATAAAAVKILGLSYRFKTDFLTTPDGRLVMKGYGDPFLVSEEFPLIVKGLKNAGLKKVSGIVADASYFARDIEVDGASRSTNPYDALNGALIANFNTINVVKQGAAVASAEPQTPLTPLARAKAKLLGGGKQRVNLGKDPEVGARYAAELLAEFLRENGVEVAGDIVVGPTPAGAAPFYSHASSKSLEDNVKGLLEFSTNFISNQLFLVLGAKTKGAPATVEKGLAALKDFLSGEVGWKNFSLAEGAGLSRQNRVTPLQMITLLNYFEPHRDLLPVKEGVLQAKTGTLTGVNTLVGYFPDPSGQGVVRFAILVNADVPYDYKFRLGKMLYNGINGR